MVDEEAVGNNELMAGEPARDGLFEKRNGCSVSSENSRMSDFILRKGARHKKACVPSAPSILS